MTKERKAALWGLFTGITCVIHFYLIITFGVHKKIQLFSPFQISIFMGGILAVIFLYGRMCYWHGQSELSMETKQKTGR